MKDSQYGPPSQETWNGGVMSGSSGGGGRRAEGGGQRGGQNQGGGGYPHWPPHPMHHHHMQSQHTQQTMMLSTGFSNILTSVEIVRVKTCQLPLPLPTPISHLHLMPRMMGGYYGGRGLPPAAAHFASGGWGRSSSGGGGVGSGPGSGGCLKPPERWTPVVGSSASGLPQQAEGGMDLSQSRPNGSQPNGVAKEPVSVIAANPLRTSEKPLEPSDRSEDEDEDCMVIEEGEEAPHSGELPPSSRQSAQTRDEEDLRQNRQPCDDTRPPRPVEDIPRQVPLDLPPVAHHNPLRQASLPVGSSNRPEISHHLPPSVTQPIRSADSSSQLQMLQKSSQMLQGLASSSSLQKLSRMESTSPLQKPGSPHLPASPLGQKSSSPSLLAQQQVLHQFAQQILVQKQMQDSQQQQLLAAQQKLPEAAFQQLLAQQKLLSTNVAAAAEAAHQMIVEKNLQAAQQMSQLASRQHDIVGKTGHVKSQTKSSSPAHTTSSSHSHLKIGLPLAANSGYISRESAVAGATGSSGLRTQQIPSQLESLTVPHSDARGFQQRHESASVPHLPINIPSSLQVIPHPKNSPSSSLTIQDRLEVTPSTRHEGLEQRPDIASLPPQVQPDQPRISESATATATSTVSTPALPSPASTSKTNDEPSLLKNSEDKSDDTLVSQPSSVLDSSNSTSNSEQKSCNEESLKISNDENKCEKENEPAENPVYEPKKEIIPQTVDHVESMLENMFQQDDICTPRSELLLPIIEDRKSPALTEDKVVEILQDKEDDIKPEIKEEIKTEVKLEPSTPQKFMQVESELEKMFAGIMETPGDSDKPETPESLQSTVKSSVKKRIRKPNRKKESTSGNSSKKKRNKSPLSNDSLRFKRKIGPRAEKIKEGSNDSSNISTDRQMYKSRGPLIKVIRGKDGTPNSVTIVNSSASTEDDKDKIFDKSLKRKAPRIIEGRTKGPGLYSSTLSSKYNSTTIDVTWTCIFCNRRSHCEGGLGGEPAGDLFGPYLVHVKVEPSIGGPSDADIVNEQRKRGGGKQLSLRAGGKANHAFSPPHKKSRKSSTSDKESASCSTNIGEISSSSNNGASTISKEVWIHEACAVWAPGVILVGVHLIGLDDAVSLSLNSKCTVCGETGACISCLHHGCHLVCHYGCARATHWSLDEETFHARCYNHKKPVSISQALLQNSA